MNHKHPKELRLRHAEAKKTLVHAKRIIKKMEQYLDSSNAHAVEVASAFFHAFKFHVQNGDLNPEDVNLAALLRAKQ